MSLAYDDLDAFLVGDEDELREPLLGDVEHVERLLRGLAWRHRKIAQARSLVESETARLAEWLAEQEKRYDTSFHLQVLEGYHRARLADDPKARTISLPSGTLTARAGQPSWQVDAEVFVPWALKALPDAVRTKHEPDKQALKKLVPTEVDKVAVTPVTADGTAVPGVVVEPPVTHFAVKVDE